MVAIILGDTKYEIDTAYRAGARAMRRGVPWDCSPHRHGSYAYDQWDAGHTHEAAGEHVRFGIDVITARRPAKYVWQEDPTVPRDPHGNVDDDWYVAALVKHGKSSERAVRQPVG